MILVMYIEHLDSSNPHQQRYKAGMKFEKKVRQADEFGQPFTLHHSTCAANATSESARVQTTPVKRTPQPYATKSTVCQTAPAI
jgi:hypothetical protein